MLQNVRDWLNNRIQLLQPDNVYLMDGSKQEQTAILSQLCATGVAKQLPKYDNWSVGGEFVVL